MMEILGVWASSLGATDTPSLPAPWAMQWYRTVGWALVLACVGAAVAGRWGIHARRLLGLGLLVWVLVPGRYSPDYWLGLAFQAPSWASVWLAGWLFARSLRGGSRPPWQLPRAVWVLVACGIATGYLLMLDTFAVLPWELYRLGFSPALLLLLTTLGLLLWVVGASTPGAAIALAAVPVATLLFAGTRLHTGNLWDALLDPLLWLALHGMALRAGLRRWRRRT